MLRWWKSLSIGARLRVQIQGALLVILLSLQALINLLLEKDVVAQAQARAAVCADGVINGMNMLMLTGMASNPDNRRLYIRKMAASGDVRELRIVRAQQVQDQFGPGLPEEQPIDDMDREVLRSGTQQSRLLRDGDRALLRVVLPFVASHDFRGTDCLACHHVQPSSVNGAASITMDLTAQYASLARVNRMLWGVQAGLQLLIFLVIGVATRHVTRPLQRLQQSMERIVADKSWSAWKPVAQPEAGDEVGGLTAAFNRMGAAMRDTVAQLQRARATQEQALARLKRNFAEKKRIGDELRLREDRLRLAKDAAELGIYDRDLDHGRIDWDERMRHLWGIGPDEPVTHELFMAAIHPDDRARVQAALDRAFDPHGNGEYRAEYRVTSRADGELRHLAANGRAYFKNGRPVRLVGTVKDVSTQKRLEREMQERRTEMQLLVDQQVAAQTAAAIAHELNQPLVSISAYSEAALSMMEGGTTNPERLAHALEGAAAQAQRAGRTLHELLAFLHKSETPMEAVDLNDIVRGALAIAEDGGWNGLHPTVDLEPELPPVRANRLQIEKVIVNLLNNGIEAMRHTGVPSAQITITVRTEAGREFARVTVRDTGPGIDAEAARRIFQPFFTTKTSGIGLGLAISRALIEAHGGQLWVDPDEGPGAAFHFTLPFAT